MSTPNRYVMVGEFKVVARGKMLDRDTNEEFDAELRINKSSVPEIETTDRENVNINFKPVRDESGVMWEIVVLDGK